MGKKRKDPENDRRVKFSAKAKFLMGSPSKIRPVADLVRNKPYVEALAILEHMPHKGARLIRRTLVSAASNVLSKNRKLDEDMLYVKAIQVNDGPRSRRIWFRARGRADMLVRQMCHIYVTVDEIARSEA